MCGGGSVCSPVSFDGLLIGCRGSTPPHPSYPRFDDVTIVTKTDGNANFRIRISLTFFSVLTPKEFCVVVDDMPCFRRHPCRHRRRRRPQRRRQSSSQVCVLLCSQPPKPVSYLSCIFSCRSRTGRLRCEPHSILFYSSLPLLDDRTIDRSNANDVDGIGTDAPVCCLRPFDNGSSVLPAVDIHLCRSQDEQQHGHHNSCHHCYCYCYNSRYCHDTLRNGPKE